MITPDEAARRMADLRAERDYEARLREYALSGLDLLDAFEATIRQIVHDGPVAEVDGEPYPGPGVLAEGRRVLACAAGARAQLLAMLP